ncbi:MAG: NYN domain-containing protein [Oscillospiraceae bacterium]|nr:NYN domain-containing protein [Oscillospiraceae bacterium]
MTKTAILVDGGFYRKRFESGAPHAPEEAADALIRYCFRHLEEHHTQHDLYRIFYYDAPPCQKKIFHPLYNRTVDFSKTSYAQWMSSFLKELTKKRKVALRLGTIDEGSAVFMLTPEATKELVTGRRGLDSLTDRDFVPSIKQKSVDMKIGMDIASLSYKKQVDQIVLIAGDADFVPAAKLARREGLDFVLDPLGRPIKEDLFEHIDGLRSCGSPYKTREKTAAAEK